MCVCFAQLVLIIVGPTAPFANVSYIDGAAQSNSGSAITQSSATLCVIIRNTNLSLI